MVKAISILGSTGSIGRQTANAASRLGVRVLALSARRDVDRLEQQAREFKPVYIGVYDPAAAAELRTRLRDMDVVIGEGEEGLVRGVHVAAGEDQAGALVAAGGEAGDTAGCSSGKGRSGL